MIREYRDTDIDAVLNIWLAASIRAHHFVEPEFWQSKLGDMRNIYIPASETVVYEQEGSLAGFYCLYEDTLAAIFVSPDIQGCGIGSALMADAKQRRPQLNLTVYKENSPSVRFYEKQGFVTVSEQIDEHTGQAELVMRYPA